MSVTPIREALVSLREQGFLELHPNRGFAVLKVSPADVSDLFLVQAFAAGELAARAARLIDTETLRRLVGLNAQFETHAKTGDARAFEIANDEFHSLINGCSDSPRLAWFYAEAIPIIPRRFLTLVPGWIEISQKDHRAIVNRLRKHDPEGSRAAMSAHIRHVGELVARHLDAGGEWPPEREEDLRQHAS